MTAARVVLAVALALAAAGCTRRNPAYCDVDQPCDPGLTCQAETHACVEDDACGAGACVCGGPEDCPAEAAACVDEACAPCTPGPTGDEACAARDPDAPACLAGACGECATRAHCAGRGDEAPHCDPDGTCAGCVLDEECGEGVCDAAARTCLTAAELIHLAADGDDDGDCDEASPCATLAGALAALAPGRQTIVVHGAGPYVAGLALDGATLVVDRVAIVGALGDRPSLVPPVDVVGVTLDGPDLSVAFRRLTLRSGDRAGVRCRGAVAWLDDVVVRAFEGLGVDAADGCTFVASRSRIEDNDGGGLALVGGTEFVVTATVVARNGYAAGASRGGVTIEDATGSFGFSTVVDNRRDAGSRAAGIDCLGELALRDNVVWGNAAAATPATPDDVGGDCLHAWSVIGEALPGGLDGGDNLADDPLLTDDGHLGRGSPAIDTADPEAPAGYDVDGDPRPAGGRADRGADERE